MSALSSFELHALRLGKLLGNLQTIETAARFYLNKASEEQVSQIMRSLPELKKGDWVEFSSFTNGDSLSQVLEEYNRLVPDFKINIIRIVDLRDALAHGRVFGCGPMREAKVLRLLKFKRENQPKKVQVTMAEDMTEEWFNENTKFLIASLEQIRKALDWNKVEL